MPHKSEYVTLEFMECYNRLLLPSPYRILHRRGPLPIDIARNTLVEEALEDDPEHILFLDDDLILPENTVYTLLSHRYPIVSVLYADKVGRACVFRLNSEGTPEPIPWDMVHGKLAYVGAVGFGAILIDARVFKLAKKKGLWPPFKYEYDPVNNPEGFSEDQFFCTSVARKLGFPILVDGRIPTGHVFTGRLIDDKRITYLTP